MTASSSPAVAVKSRSYCFVYNNRAVTVYWRWLLQTW